MRFSFSRQTTDDHDAQNQRQISAQMGRAVCDRNSLFKRGLITSDGDLLMMPINDRFLKKYYP